MEPQIHTETTARVKWNGLEATILADIFDMAAYELIQEYSLRDLKYLNNAVAQSLNPDNPKYTVQDKFQDRDNCGTYENPVEALFDRTETLIANFERAKTQTASFEYDEEAVL
jgi:hypothetical protein